MTVAFATEPSIETDRPPSRIASLAALALRPGSLGIFGQATLSAANFLTGVALGRACGDDCLGIYALAMSCVYIGIGVQTELTSSPYHVYCVRRSGSALARYTGSVLIHQTISLLLLALAAAAILGSTGQLDRLRSVLLVFLWAGPLLVTREFVRQMTFARMEFRLAACLDVLAAAVQLGLIGTAWWLDRLSPSVALAAGGMAGASTYGVWMWRHRADIRLTPSLASLHWVRNFRFGRWTVATYLVGSTLPFLMPWVLAALHDEDAVGRLAACNTLIGLSYMFTIGIANALTGRVTRDYREGGAAELMATLRRVAGIIAAVLVPFIVGVAVLGDWAIDFVFGFPGLGHVSLIIAVGVLAQGLSMVAGNGLWAIERPQDGFVADALTLVVAIALAAALVPSYAVVGAALATVGGQIVGMIVRWVALGRSLAAEGSR